MSNRRIVELGRIVGTRRTLGLATHHRLQTHMHVVGSTRTGKSRFLQHLIQQDILSGRGLCLIDPHGSLAEKVLRWTSRLAIPPKRFHYIAPWRDDWTVCYNPLYKHPRHKDDSFLVTAMKLATVKCWGSDDTQDTPRLDEWLRHSYYTAVTLGLTLPEVAMLLQPSVDRNIQRRAIAERLPESRNASRAAYFELCQLAEKGKWIEFEARVGSTNRRLTAFLDNPRLRRMFGVPDVSIDLAACMDEGAILIVDLSPKGQFHYEDANLFGTLLLTDFYVQMFNRQRTERPFFLYIDEFQNFATKDIARFLDESLKFGLSLCLAHQRPGQLQSSESAEDRDIYSAVMSNARNKIVFGGVHPEELKPIAELLSMGQLDPKKVKNEIWMRSVLDYRKEYWQAHSRGTSHSGTTATGGSSGSGMTTMSGSSAATSHTFDPSGTLVGPGPSLHLTETAAWSHTFGTSDFSGSSWMDADTLSESESTTTFPVLVPVMGQQLSSIYYETLEEQLYQFMAILYDQEQRHAMTRVMGQDGPLPIVVPFVSDPEPLPHQIERQLELGYKGVPFFLPVSQAMKLVDAKQHEFMNLGLPVPEVITSRQEKTDHVKVEESSSMPKQTPPPTLTINLEGLQLNRRDIDLLADVFESRFITIHHAGLLHFGNLKNPSQGAKARLARFADAGLLDARRGNFGLVRLPSTKVQEVKLIYVFTKKALDVLSQHDVLPNVNPAEWDSALRKRFDTIADSTIAHEIAVLDVKAALKPAWMSCAAKFRVLEFGVWPWPHRFTAPKGGRMIAFLPDGFVDLLEYVRPGLDPVHHYFYIELDRATQTLDAVADKAEAYRYHLQKGGFVAQLGFPKSKPSDHPFRVLFIIDTKDPIQRRNNIASRLSEMGVQTHTPITTLPELVSDPLGAIWLTPRVYVDWVETRRQGPVSLTTLFD